MAVKYIKPEALLGSNADDDYLKRVLSYGDTIYADDQIQACRDFGVKASYFQDGLKSDLIDELERGFPVAVGFLHKGSPTAAWGGGHWSLLIGATDTHGIFHDPYGELDNVNGGYVTVGQGGERVSYSWRNWLPRWQPRGDTGWYMTFRPL